MIPFHRPFQLNFKEQGIIQERIAECLEMGQLTNGDNVRELEDKIREMYDVEHCIALSSCTQGLLACVQFINEWECGFDYIRLPSFTWGSLGWILKIIGISPIWTDIDRKTWLPYSTNEKYSIGHHTFGNISMNKATIFDGSHALGCRLKHIGEATVFSLAATKLITSCEGGLVITNNDELAEFVREYRDKCARMSEIHAIIGLQMLSHIDEIKEWKRKVYRYYRENLPGQFQEVIYDSNYNTIAFININKLIIPKEIETRQYYIPLNKGLPNSDYVHENIVCLPSYYNAPIERIVELINEVNK